MSISGAREQLQSNGRSVDVLESEDLRRTSGLDLNWWRIIACRLQSNSHGWGVNREKLIAWDVPHLSDPATREPKALRPPGPFELVYAGSIVEAKGVPELVRAIALLRRQRFDVRCSLAGGGDLEKMQSLARSLGASRLAFVPRRRRQHSVLDTMAAADLVVVPSRVTFPEGFPLAMFEAIASRTPIVCSDHPMFREVMIDGRNASVFSSGDHRSLAAAIRRALTDPTLYATLSANAPLTWAALQGPADWRTMIFKWVVEGRDSPWVSRPTCSRRPPRPSRQGETVAAAFRPWADRFEPRGDAALVG